MKTTITLILLTIATQAHAGRNTIVGWLEGVTGVFTAYAAHEVGHAIALYATNTDPEWHTGEYNQPIAFTEHASSSRDGITIHGSGLMAQAVLSELILQSDLDKNDPFVRGMMAWNIINPILYMLDYNLIRRTNYETEDRYQGDLEGVEHYAGNDKAQTFAFGMAALAAAQGYRFIKTQTWAPDWIRCDDIRFNLAPVDRGMALMVEIDF